MTHQTLNIQDLRKLAQRRLPRGLFEFVDRGTEDEVALENNRAAFDRIKLKSRGLVDVAGRSQAIELFGQTHDMPIVIAPTGAAGLLSYRGEVAVAKAAAAANIPFTLSTASITAMETVAAAAGGRLWFQLYMWPDQNMSYRLVDRAWDAGFATLMITIDTVASPNREYNLRNGFGFPFRFNRRNTVDVLRHPGWLLSVITRHLIKDGAPTFENYPEEIKHALLSRAGKDAATLKNESMTWDDLARLRDHWRGHFLVKGIMTVEDARAAVAAGADGIVVSNHGGRNFDSAPAPIEMLPHIVDAVGADTAVLVDSGFTRGSHIIKALALGARAVLVGRGPLYGVAAGGEAGVHRALTIYRQEIDRVLAYMGHTRADAVSRHDIARIPPGPGDESPRLSPVSVAAQAS